MVVGFGGVFFFSVCIALVNLDYAALWHDEAANAILARTWLTTGALSGWDGRNLFVGNNGLILNARLYPAALPPLPALPSMLGLLLFLSLIHI